MDGVKALEAGAVIDLVENKLVFENINSNRAIEQTRVAQLPQIKRGNSALYRNRQKNELP
jgi:hypothetical protein